LFVFTRDCILFLFCIFFFSSRRRHTRCYRDWSSDVCSSDLLSAASLSFLRPRGSLALAGSSSAVAEFAKENSGRHAVTRILANRSEERRVGKECRCGWETYQ